MKNLSILFFVSLIFLSCTTVDVEKVVSEENEEYPLSVKVESITEIEKPEPQVIIVEKPVYFPLETAQPLPKTEKGEAAVKQSLLEATKLPETFSGGMTKYDYNEKFVYEIYCQPYRITDIQLEAGEEVLELPFVSEPDVWQIGAGVSKNNGIDRQHFFVKPTYSKLTTSMVIMTNRRVYHVILKSFSDYYQPMVSWNYPLSALPFNILGNVANNEQKTTDTVSPEHLSFNYKLSYFIRPVWLPKQVYDDGRKTYIVLDEQTLHQEMPALFNNKNDIINYRVQANILIVDQLISKMTLKLGKRKVVIEKKK